MEKFTKNMYSDIQCAAVFLFLKIYRLTTNSNFWLSFDYHLSDVICRINFLFNGIMKNEEAAHGFSSTFFFVIISDSNDEPTNNNFIFHSPKIIEEPSLEVLKAIKKKKNDVCAGTHG